MKGEPPPYAELIAATNFSFLRGASPPQDMVLTSLLLGHAGIGIADRNSVAGVVRAHAALRDLREHGEPPPDRLRQGSGPGEYLFLPSPRAAALTLTADDIRRRAQAFRLLSGARLIFMDGTPDIVAYPQNRAGWGNLCRLLTLGNRRARKGECHLSLDDLLAHVDNLLLIVRPEMAHDGLPATLTQLREAAPGSTWLGAAMQHSGADRRRLARLKALAATARVPLIAVNDALYDRPEQRDLQDVLTCIREGTSIDRAGRLLEANAERHLKPAAEMARLFRDAPEAIAEVGHLLARVDFTLDQLRYEYPDEQVPPGWEPQGWLEELVRRRAPMRYPDGVPAKVEKLLAEELALIRELDYARYFLTIRDIVDFAENRGILCQGRGSAANSAVCYVLGITAVDPSEHDLLFARFISTERREPPDIDVDFEHERREEVIQHIYSRYGRERAGIAATVISYRPRSAIRDVGKALGLTEDVTARLARTQWGSWGTTISDSQIRQAGFDPSNPMILRAVGFALRLLGFPRHLSQHVGGFVLTRGRLDELVPIGNAAMADRTFIEWDKDDIDTLGLMKVDVLALGMLTCIRKAFDLLREHEGIDIGLADVPADDPATYDMLCQGRSLGVFQVESRAQMNMLPRLKPRRFYDLVIQVAIVRPGPIQGDMVHPYLRRRAGLERTEFPAPAPPHPPDELYQVLKRTCGVPLFQEQAMKIAMVAAEFTPAQANGLRRAMATFRNVGTIGTFEKLMVDGMVRRGYEPDFARRCFEQIKGFGSYGFPESHAASFAKLVYVSSWLKCHHPAIFACALLNAQPMGFYAPAQIVREMQEPAPHKGEIEARAIDVNHSLWDNTLERDGDMRGRGTLPPCGGGQGGGVGEGDNRRVAQPAVVLRGSPDVPSGLAPQDEERGDWHISQGSLPDPTALMLRCEPSQRRASKHAQPLCKDGQPPCGEAGHDRPGQHRIISSTGSSPAGPLALRLGFRQLDGFHADWADRLVAARTFPFDDVERLARHARLSARAMRLLADADSFRSMGLDRREALWAVRRIPDDEALPLFAAASARELGEDKDAFLPDMPIAEHVAADYQTARLSLKGHPMGILRPLFRGEGFLACEGLEAARDGGWVKVAGVVLVRQRPGKGNAIFMTLEDETGIANIVLWARKFEQYRKEVMGARLLAVSGRVQKGPPGVIHVMAEHLADRTAELARLSDTHETAVALSRADEILRPQIPRGGHPRNVRILPRSRDFH